VPRISRSLLSRRLNELERAGLIKRGAAKKGLDLQSELNRVSCFTRAGDLRRPRLLC
jgi:DNA-binding HxlR family transcriptional regulator